MYNKIKTKIKSKNTIKTFHTFFVCVSCYVEKVKLKNWISLWS